MRKMNLVILAMVISAVFQLHALPKPPEPASPPVKPQHSPGVAVEAANLGSPLLLDHGWHVGVTFASDLSPAQPEFDDSSWTQASETMSPDDISGAQQRFDEHSPRTRSFVWYRLHLNLPKGHTPLSLLIDLPVAQKLTMVLGSEGPAVDVFANGKQIRPEGPHRDAPQHYQQITRLYNLNVPPEETSLTLVVRSIYIPFGPGATSSFFSTRAIYLGHANDLSRSLELWSIHTLFEHLPRIINALLTVLLAIFLLALYFAQKGHIEYLWLALVQLCAAPIGFLSLAASTGNFDLIWYIAVLMQIVCLGAYFEFEFLVAFLSLPRRWYVLTLRYWGFILIAAAPVMLWAGKNHFNFASIVLFILISAGILLWMGGWLLFTFCTLLAATLRRNFEAGVLLIPFVLSMIGIIEPLLTAGMSDWGGRPFRSPLTVYAGPIPIHFASIAEFIGILAIVLIIFGRFLKIQRNQERTSSELAAARSIQELMIPIEKLKTPGFEVDSVYNPANEVGGDFFHVQPAADGGMLIVLGDVAGKGLKAAMSVSMLIGALRRITEKKPAKILEELNRVLAGNDSFTTCQAAWFGANGELIIANAGHLPPYLNSQEIALPGGLPLGVLPEVHYEELHLYLHPGDRVLLLSDGVVEARQPSGELFGFDRIHNLSNQSAFYIADAAKAFGQEDDITVLTVKRMPEMATV